MKEKLIKLWNLFSELFTIYCVVMCSALAIAFGIALPRYGIITLILVIIYKLLSKYGNKNKE